MNKVSIVIPAREEVYLSHTVKSLLDNAKGKIEIIVVLDGYKSKPKDLPKDKRVKVIWRKKSKGMRNAINTGAKKATGKYLMKCDAHCAFDEGYDVKLVKDCEPDWVVVPRRYAIDKKDWTKHRLKELYYDFQYISHPKDPKYKFKGVDWPEYGVRVPEDQQIVDLMTSQGSCWFMHKEFFEKIGGLDEKNYGTMGAEAQEICLKAWLSGGRYVLNRGTWYAHKKKRVGKRLNDRGYKKPRGEWGKSRSYAIKCWTKNKWPGQTRNLAWLIKKFRPVPGWHTRIESVKANNYILEKYKLGHGREKFPRIIKGLNRDGMVRLWKELGYKAGAEIGVAKGDFSNLMFKGIPGLKMYLVDQYKDYKGISKYARPHKSAKETAHKLMEGRNAVWLEELSETIFNKVKDRSLDFVYIDGNHKYSYVMLDIILWSRKVRRGGMIAGHDYNTFNKEQHKQVRAAVNDYTRFYEIAPWYLTDNTARHYKSDRHASWFWIK